MMAIFYCLPIEFKIPFRFLKKKPIENMIQRAANFIDESIDELTVSHHNQTNSIKLIPTVFFLDNFAGIKLDHVPELS